MDKAGTISEVTRLREMHEKGAYSKTNPLLVKSEDEVQKAPKLEKDHHLTEKPQEDGDACPQLEQDACTDCSLADEIDKLSVTEMKAILRASLETVAQLQSIIRLKAEQNSVLLQDLNNMTDKLEQLTVCTKSLHEENLRLRAKKN